jgi:hypothetical protein
MELVKVWDTKGEPFEMSVANANDVVTHLGWSRSAPAKAKAVPVAAEEPKVVVAEAKTEDEEVETAPIRRGRPPSKP